MNHNFYEPNSNYSDFDQPPQYSINHQPPNIQENLNWQKIYELLQTMQSSCKKLLQQQQATDINQSTLQDMSLREMEDLKQHYLDEMLSLSNDFGIKDYWNEKIDICFRRECEDTIDELKGKFNGMSIEINKKKERQYLEQVANLSTYSSQRFNSFCYDDDDDYDYEKSTIPLNEIISQIPSSIAITPSSVEDLVPNPCEYEDTSESDSDCNLPSRDDFSSINLPEEKSVTFSNPLFDSNDDFTSSDDESLSDEDVSEEIFKIYSNPLFEFDYEYISSDVNPLFDKVFKDIENKDSYVSNLDEPTLLVTPLSDVNEDECFDPGGDIDEIDAFLDIDVPTDIKDGFHDSEGDIIYLESLLNDDTIPNLPSEVFLDHDQRSLKDDLDNLMTEDKVFDPGICDKKFSPTYMSLPFVDHHYFSLTYVIRIFLPYFTYPVDSLLLLSSGSEDTIFDPDISAFHFSFREPVASHRSETFMCFNFYPNILNKSPMEIGSSTCFDPNITMIWGESS
ncbi:hypothetical protein Tco_0359602 [Tanacetum coccineum]